MRYVIDASVAVSWCFDDENDPIAGAAFDLLEEGARALAPSLFWFELRHVVLTGTRRNRITRGNAAAVLARIDRAAIGFAPLPQDDVIFALATRHRLSFYDAVYLELAQRENIALATLDQALARAAAAEGVPLIGA